MLIKSTSTTKEKDRRKGVMTPQEGKDKGADPDYFENDMKEEI
jgi:hypothetical protein